MQCETHPNPGDLDTATRGREPLIAKGDEMLAFHEVLAMPSWPPEGVWEIFPSWGEGKKDAFIISY